MNIEPLPQLLNLDEVASRLGVCRRTVVRLIAAGSLCAVKIGSATRIPVSELVRYVDELSQQSRQRVG
jgi:excisionase family DNA binding protein